MCCVTICECLGESKPFLAAPSLDGQDGGCHSPMTHLGAPLLFTSLPLGLSLFLQLLAAYLAIRLIPTTGKWPAWTCIATALVLMSLRRAITFFRLISGDEIHVDPAAEWVALSISVLMVVGIVGIRSLFLSISETGTRLREGEHLLRLMLNQLPSILWTTDLELRITASLGSGLANLGLKPSQVDGMTLPEYFQTDDPEFLPIAKQRAAAGGKSGTYEIEWQERAFDCRVEPFRDASGEIVGTIGVAHDVTDEREAQKALQRSHADLERRVEERTAELQSANDQLKAEQASLRRLYEMLEHERQMIGYEIHDGLVQYATGAVMRCEALSESSVAEPIREKLDIITELVRKTVQEGRSLVNGLRPPSLDEYGLVAGVEEFVHELDGLKVEFHHSGVTRLAPIMENALYRIVQESITNAQKYSQGTSIEIRLEKQDGVVAVEIKDDGVGFDPENLPNGHYGVRGIQERARLLGGTVVIDSAPNAGTRVHVELPLLEVA